MSKLQLTTKIPLYVDQIMEFKEEMHAANSSFDGCNGLDDVSTPFAWFDNVESTMRNCKQYLVLDEKDRVVGMMNICIKIEDDEYLKTRGGNIGYSVRPSDRLKGYGTDILSQALYECRKLGLERVLVTCDQDNEGSRKIIKHNGGVYANYHDDGDGNIVERYWITLS